jgi:hypothetical protein
MTLNNRNGDCLLDETNGNGLVKEPLDVTDIFNEQLRKTERFFSPMGSAFDAIYYPDFLTREIERRALKLAFFSSQVGTGKEYDIKQPNKGFSPDMN